MHRTLLVGRIAPGAAPHIAALFTESDSNSPLPGLIGVHSRTLFQFGDLYMHLVEGKQPIRLAEHLEHPDYRQISQDLRPYISPYTPETWRNCLDGRAEEFYRWDTTG